MTKNIAYKLFNKNFFIQFFFVVDNEEISAMSIVCYILYLNIYLNIFIQLNKNS